MMTFECGAPVGMEVRANVHSFLLAPMATHAQCQKVAMNIYSALGWKLSFFLLCFCTSRIFPSLRQTADNISSPSISPLLASLLIAQGRGAKKRFLCCSNKEATLILFVHSLAIAGNFVDEFCWWMVESQSLFSAIKKATEESVASSYCLLVTYFSFVEVC